MKTKEKQNNQKQEGKNKKLSELSEKELQNVAGGLNYYDDPTGYQVSPRMRTQIRP